MATPDPRSIPDNWRDPNEPYYQPETAPVIYPVRETTPWPEPEED